MTTASTQPRICAAIARAVRESGRFKKDVARDLGIDPSTLTHYMQDRHPDLPTIEAIERALALPHGRLFIEAGYVSLPERPEDLIRSDPRLTPGWSRIAYDSLRTALSASAEERGETEVPASVAPTERSRRFAS